MRSTTKSYTEIFELSFIDLLQPKQILKMLRKKIVNWNFLNQLNRCIIIVNSNSVKHLNVSDNEVFFRPVELVWNIKH